MFQYLNWNKIFKYAEAEDQVGIFGVSVQSCPQFPNVLQASALLKIFFVKQDLSDKQFQVSGSFLDFKNWNPKILYTQESEVIYFSFHKSQHCCGSGMNTVGSKDDSEELTPPNWPHKEPRLLLTLKLLLSPASPPQPVRYNFHKSDTRTAQKLYSSWPLLRDARISKGFRFSPLPFFVNSRSKNKYI